MQGSCVISLMKSRRVAGMPTILSFMTLKSFLKRREVVSMKLMELVFFWVPSTSLVWASKNFFILMFPFSQNSCKNLKILQRAN